METILIYTQAVALISLVASFIYTRLGILYTFYANAPTRLQGVNNFKTTSIRFRNLIRNCEDGIIDAERGFALLSCDPGRDNWNTVMVSVMDVRRSLANLITGRISRLKSSGRDGNIYLSLC